MISTVNHIHSRSSPTIPNAAQEYGITAASSDSDSVVYTCSINCPAPAAVNHTPLIVGLVVGLGGGLILIAILATFFVRRQLHMTARTKYLAPNASVVQDAEQPGVPVQHVGTPGHAEKVELHDQEELSGKRPHQAEQEVAAAEVEIPAGAVALEVEAHDHPENAAVTNEPRGLASHVSLEVLNPEEGEVAEEIHVVVDEVAAGHVAHTPLAHTFTAQPHDSQPQQQPGTAEATIGHELGSTESSGKTSASQLKVEAHPEQGTLDDVAHSSAATSEAVPQPAVHAQPGEIGGGPGVVGQVSQPVEVVPEERSSKPVWKP